MTFVTKLSFVEEKAFKKNTSSRKRNGRYTIKCKRGFWSVTCPKKELAEREARYYFIQYYMDGEYD